MNKQQKSSRIFNDKLRKSFEIVTRKNQVNVYREGMFRNRREIQEQARITKNAPALAIPPISFMRRREGETPRTSLLNLFKNLFRKSA